VLNELFVQLNSCSFVMCHVETFEQIKMDGWMDAWMAAKNKPIWRQYV